VSVDLEVPELRGILLYLGPAVVAALAGLAGYWLRHRDRKP
jgi:uncharacterized protein (TIGR03382 family)